MRRRPRAEDYPFFDNAGMPIAYAHRGGALTGDGLGLENTMVAFATAVELGYRYIETDVRATADGVLLAFHDGTLERSTDRTGVIARLPYDAVRKAKIDGREPIPLLADVLSSWPDLHVNIDAKANSAVQPLASAIAEHRAWDRVCVASFNARRLSYLRQLVGRRVASALSPVEVAAWRYLPRPVLRQLSIGRGGQAAQVPVRHGPVEVVTCGFIERAHDLGKVVHVWTIDAPAQMCALLDQGVDAIISDRIDLLRDVFQARGVWNGPRR
ncbi:MAG: glycerophosphodiester phosphodiesterase family protein [Nocardioidaceae bacterium]